MPNATRQLLSAVEEGDLAGVMWTQYVFRGPLQNKLRSPFFRIHDGTPALCRGGFRLNPVL